MSLCRSRINWSRMYAPPGARSLALARSTSLSKSFTSAEGMMLYFTFGEP